MDLGAAKLSLHAGLQMDVAQQLAVVLEARGASAGRQEHQAGQASEDAYRSAPWPEMRCPTAA